MIQKYLSNANVKSINLILNRKYLSSSIFLKNSIKSHSLKNSAVNEKTFFESIQKTLFHKTSFSPSNNKDSYHDGDDKDEDIKSLSTEEIQIILDKKIETLKLQNLLIYRTSENLSLQLNLLGLAVSIIFIAVGSLFYTSPRLNIDVKENDENSSFFLLVLAAINDTSFRATCTAVLVILGVASFLSLSFFTSRLVNRVYLLKGGKKIGVITDGLFGREISTTIDLSKISFKLKRSTQIGFLSFKKTDEFMKSYFIDKRRGEFKEKLLFDYIICLKR